MLSSFPLCSSLLKGFPFLVIGHDVNIFRIYKYRDKKTGKVRKPFYFASIPKTSFFIRLITLLQKRSKLQKGGRYDLPFPNGACYFGASKIGPFLEVFQKVRTIFLEDLYPLRMCISYPPNSINVADLLAMDARRFGITHEVHGTNEYTITRELALRLYKAGFQGLWGMIRYDTTAGERSVTLFDKAGEHFPFEWEWKYESRRLEGDEELISAAKKYGYEFWLLSIPYEVKCVSTDKLGY